NVYAFRASVRDLIRFCDLDFLGGYCSSFLTHQIVCPPRTAIGSSFFGNGLLSRVYWVSQSSSACICALSVPRAMSSAFVKWTVLRRTCSMCEACDSVGGLGCVSARYSTYYCKCSI